MTWVATPKCVFESSVVARCGDFPALPHIFRRRLDVGALLLSTLARTQGTTSSVGSTKPFGEARDADAAEIKLLDLFEAFAQVEGGGGCVLRASLNDCAFGCGLDFERAADECGCDAAAKVFGVDN
jgi:hypothetical protein